MSADNNKRSFWVDFALNTFGVLVAANTVTGVHCDSVLSLMAAALMLGLFRALLRPVLMLISLPLIVLTLGLFVFVINAGLLYLVSSIVTSFQIDSFWSAFKGAFVISLVSWLLGVLTGTSAPVRVRNRPSNAREPKAAPQPPAGKGPIIDV